MLTDAFGAATAQDLKTGGDGTKSFGWHVRNTANADAINVNTTNAGFLTIDCNAVSSGMGTTITGPYCYKLVTGDFDIETSIVDNADQQWEQAGLIVASDANENLHADIINYFNGTSANVAARNSDGTTETVLGTDVANSQKRFRLVRSGNTFSFYRKLNAGDAWTIHTTFTRTDLGSTVRVGLYAGPNNTNNNYVATFDYFQVNSADELTFTMDEFENVPTAGATDGSVIAAGLVPFSVTERSGSSVTVARKLAVRLTTGAGTVTITPSGGNASLITLAPDNAGVPGTWGAYGAALNLGTVGTTNACFWVRCIGAATDAFGIDDSSWLSLSSTGGQSGPLYVRRLVVPTLAVLGTAPNQYLGYDWGGGTTWRHSATAAGDIDVLTADGLSFTNIVYPSSSVSGAVTTLGTVTLTTGLTLTTKFEKKAEGLCLVTHTLQSSIDRWVSVKRNLLDGAAGASVAGTADVLTFPATTSVVDETSRPFVAAAAKHTSGAHVGIIAGNGYDNDWCHLDWDYTGQTSWFNKNVVNKGSNFVQLLYGLLANGSTSDYTVQLKAGIARDISYVLCAHAPTTQAELNEALYSGYHDCYSGVAGRNRVEKLLWATASQLKRLKRHIRVEGAKELVIAPSRQYAGMISLGDMAFEALGLGEPATMSTVLSLFHRLGAQDGAAAGGSVAGSAGNTLDGSFGVWMPWVELYAKNFLSYAPDATAQAQYLAVANSYADAINNVKLIPDASTKLAHYYSDLFAGPESQGFGDFEQPFSFTQENETRSRWTGIGATRVTTTGGVTPRSGSNMAQLVRTGGTDAFLTMMRMAVPGGKAINASAYVNIPVAFTSAGARIVLREYASDGTTLLATTNGPAVASTSGWQQITASVTTNASTVYLVLELQAQGANGTAYFDDVQAQLVAPDFPGMLWNVSIMPPQLKGDTLCPGAFSMVWTQLNLLCLKQLMGGAWTTTHQTALDNVNATFPAAYWTDGTHSLIKEDRYHAIRKNWITSWGLFGNFIYFIVSGGQKIFSDADVASLYAGHPAKSAGQAFGNVFKVGWIADASGNSIPSGANFTGTFLADWPTTAGYYINAGGWMWASDTFFHQSAIWGNVAGARANRLNRLRAEIGPAYHTMESINTLTGEVGNASAGVAASLFYGYGTNSIALAVAPAAGFVSDTITIADSIASGSGTSSRTAADTIHIADMTVRVRGLPRTANDNITIGDLAVTGGGGTHVSRTARDTIVIGGSIASSTTVPVARLLQSPGLVAPASRPGVATPHARNGLIAPAGSV